MIMLPNSCYFTPVEKKPTKTKTISRVMYRCFAVLVAVGLVFECDVYRNNKKKLRCVKLEQRLFEPNAILDFDPGRRVSHVLTRPSSSCCCLLLICSPVT